ncbi:hypothetical protein [Agromyces aureus]|uniref:Glycosyltransferase RgtA/B/C/D-like domain-containing protein n=1 Tax=Agromyces aureus TaxID=453304 RepID=A0A191WHF4_9MICO|nr:hypothetical protein [Agromyces aureus]ANJ27691.1 hypothetical protein ATC03_14210 [Agromyces aureus]
MSSAFAGSIGLLLQFALFALAYLLLARSRGHARALLYGAVVAVYGYALTLAFGLLFGIPWAVTNAVLLLLVGLSFLSRRVRKGVANGWGEFAGAARTGWGAIVIVGLIAAFHVAIGVVKPELSVDGELYHGPVLALLVQSGNLWGWNALNEYVFYSDLTMVGGVNLASFTGEARFDDALQIPHLVVLMLAINFALKSRFPRAWMRVGLAALIVSAPVIWMQPRILYVDLAYGTALVTCIFLVVLTKRFGAVDILVAATAAAAVLATKPTGILTSVLLIAALAAVVIWRRMAQGARFWRTFGIAALTIGVPSLAALSFYIRNFVSFSNPVYPVKVSMGPIQFPGIVDLSVFTSGERGTGLFDIQRIGSFLDGMASGVLHGMTKPDYDPRAGGFGHVPAFVLAVVAAILLAQLVLFLVRRRRGSAAPARGQWLAQAAIAGLSVLILVMQPSTFDARYVIGPTVGLLVAMLMTTVITTPRIVDVLAVSLAMLLATGQIVWNERNVYPGVSALLQMRSFDSGWQPDTPGNPWGTPDYLAWLPSSDEGCVSIAVQTAGGLTPVGLTEQSLLATLPYSLYGDALCNTVVPIEFDENGGAREGGTQRSALPTADFAVLYESDAAAWSEVLPGGADCWIEVGAVEASPSYPVAAVVVRNICD